MLTIFFKWYIKFRHPRFTKAARLAFDPDGYHHYPYLLKNDLKKISADQLIAALPSELASFIHEKTQVNAQFAYNALANAIIALPDLLESVIELINDSSITKRNKENLFAIIIYLLSPVDVIPEGAPNGAGYADDALFASIALNAITDEGQRRTVFQEWLGEEEMLDNYFNLAGLCKETLPGLYLQVEKMFEKIYL